MGSEDNASPIQKTQTGKMSPTAAVMVNGQAMKEPGSSQVMDPYSQQQTSLLQDQGQGGAATDEISENDNVSFLSDDSA